MKNHTKPSTATIQTIGRPSIPRSQQPQLLDDARSLFQEGGLVTTEPLEMFGRRVTLLYPAKMEGDSLKANFSYYDDLPIRLVFHGDGTAEAGELTGAARDVTAAALLMAEEASSTPYYANVGPDAEPTYRAARWLSHLLDKPIPLSRRNDLWPVMEALHAADPDGEVQDTAAYPFVPICFQPTVNNVSAMAVCYGIDAVIALGQACEEDDVILHVVEDLQELCGYLHRLKDGLGCKALIQRTQDVLALSPATLDGLLAQGGELAELAAYTASFPAPLVVAALAEEVGEDFWALWDELKPIDREPALMCQNPVEPMSTEELLGIQALDRLAAWKPGGDVELTEDSRRWLWAIRERYRMAMSSDLQPQRPDQFIADILDDLGRAARELDGLYAPGAAFENLVAHAGERKYQMLWRVFRCILDMSAEPPIIVSGTELPDYFSGHLAAKRFLGLLANRELTAAMLGESNK